MRFITARTYELVEYDDESQIPAYAILSHTWGNGEVTLQDMRYLSSEVKSSKDGWSKIEIACKIALRYELDFVWVDTCCIDKTDSAELSEAINSMFKWYKSSKICFAYLVDVTANDEDPEETAIFDARWWRRGWTLQELIAPRNLRFYDCVWQDLGSKNKWAKAISKRIGIPIGALQGDLSTTVASVAQKFSWAAERQTKRLEDEAYCLLGIFDVNMPLLYGEGSKAFRRLQEEIIKQRNDLTIFAHDSGNFTRSLFAQKPADFRKSGDLHARRTIDRVEFSITNRGLHIIGEVPIYAKYKSRNGLEREATYFMLLGDDLVGHYSVLYLTKVGPQLYRKDHSKALGTFAYLQDGFGMSQSSDCHILLHEGRGEFESHTGMIAGAIVLPSTPIQNATISGPPLDILPYDFAPYASYNHARRIFHRRNVLYTARDPGRDVVIAIKSQIQLKAAEPPKDPLTEVVVLCDCSRADPKAFVFEPAKHPRLEAFLFADVNKENSVVWQLLNILYPSTQILTDSLHFRSGRREYRLKAFFEKRKLDSNDFVDVHHLQIGIERLKE